MDGMKPPDIRFERWMRMVRSQVKVEMRELADLRRFNRELGDRLDRYTSETDHKISAIVKSRQRTEACLRAFIGCGAGRGA